MNKATKKKMILPQKMVQDKTMCLPYKTRLSDNKLLVKKRMKKSKKVEIKPWKTIKDRWNIDEKGEHKGLREKSFKFWKTRLLSAKLQNCSLPNVNNR